MPRSWSPGTATDTWPLPPEVPPYRPPQPPPYQPSEPPSEPPPPGPPPTPILPTWEEPDPGWADRQILDRLLDQRVILVTGHLDAAVAQRVSAQLLLLDRTDHTRPIEVHLSCRGSDLEASVALAATVDLIRADVRAVVTGTLSGPALAVLCATQERAAHRHAAFVLAVPHASAQGSATTVAGQAEEHQRMIAQLVQRVSTSSGRPEAQVDEDLRSGRVLNAEQARTYGLVSSVV
jgi:ATP-dependent Clp protease protease subunit